MDEQPIIVTGSDRKYFLMTCLLISSLRRWASGIPAFVLDFGLDPAQQHFLNQYVTVLKRPNDLPSDLHPYIYKTAIARYLREVDWSSLIWFDSDMVAVGPISKGLSAALNNMRSSGKEMVSP